jgi:hypothetical protein
MHEGMQSIRVRTIAGLPEPGCTAVHQAGLAPDLAERVGGGG